MAQYAKGVGPVSATFAQGGPVLTSKSRFVKDRLIPADDTWSKKIRANKADDAPTTVSEFLNQPSVFRHDIERNSYEKTGKGGEQSKLEGETKKLPTIKPKKS